MLNKAAITLDTAQREKLLNDAEVTMAKQVPSIPMYARPIYVIRANGVNGPVVNPTQEGTSLEHPLLAGDVIGVPLREQR